MARFLAPPPYKAEQTGPAADVRYKRLRMEVFMGAFIGYAAFYIVRNNFSMAMPDLVNMGFDKADLGLVFGFMAVAYALSKFLMGSVSDRSDARKFLPLGLVLTSIAMVFMIVPVMMFAEPGPDGNMIVPTNRKMIALILMGVLNFAVGWFNGMGWPPCGRVMTHWFSQNERGTMMSIWNCAHNVGGALVGPMAAYGAGWFGSWFYHAHTDLYFLAGTYIFPSVIAVLIAVIAWVLLRDTPQSCGLPAVEKWRNDYPSHYSEKSETVLTAKEIFFKYVFPNKFLWFVACANAFIYMVRYGALNWAPTLLTESGLDIKQAGWAYAAYELAAIPGTLVCGWLSDKVFKGRRAMPTIIFMALIIVFIGIYWHAATHINPASPGDSMGVVLTCLIAIGFLIYGPVMLIGVQALDLVPKNAAGTAAGLTGFFGYFFGTFILSNWLVGLVADKAGWGPTFILLIGACLLSIFFMALTYGEEKKGMQIKNTPKDK